MSPSTHSTSGASAASTDSISPRPNAPYSSWICSRLDTWRTLSPRCRLSEPGPSSSPGGRVVVGWCGCGRSAGARAYLGARPWGRRRDGRWVDPRGATPAARSLVDRRRWAGVAAVCGSGPEDWLSSGSRGRGGTKRCQPGDWFQGVGAELTEGVETAPGELARDRQRGPGVRQPARLEREVVGAVGARRPARRLGRFVERPAQLRRSLPSQLAGPRAAVGAVHADIEAGAAHRLARRRQARHVAELAADPVVAHQRPATGLAAGQPAQPLLERGELAVERLDHRQRHLDPLAGGVGQLESGEEVAALGAQQLVRRAPDAVVEERRLDSLQPARALVDERLAQPRAGAPLAHVRRRDPGLRQPTVAEQRAQPAGVLAVGLGAPLLAPQRARLDRLGQMRDRPGLDQRLAHKQPARARLDRDVKLPVAEPARPLAHGLRRGPHPTSLDLARLLVESVETDLPSMHIKPGYDRHRGLL